MNKNKLYFIQYSSDDKWQLAEGIALVAAPSINVAKKLANISGCLKVSRYKIIQQSKHKVPTVIFNRTPIIE